VRRGKVGGYREYLSADDQEYAADALMQLDPRFEYNSWEIRGPEPKSRGRLRWPVVFSLGRSRSESSKKLKVRTSAKGTSFPIERRSKQSGWGI